MANKCKRKSQRKTEMIGIRVTPKEKERIEKLACIRGVTSTELIRTMFDGLLENQDRSSKEIWKFLYCAARSIDQKENEWRDML